VVGRGRDDARELGPGGPPADDDEGEQRVPLGRVVRLLGLLEGEQEAATDLEGVVDALETRRVLLPLIVAEVGVPRPGGEHQEVVRDLAPLLVHVHDAPLGVHLLHRGHEHRGVPLFAQEPADGHGDVARGQHRRRHLVEQRLEEVVVRAVDDRHVHRGALELLRRLDPREPAADDHHVRAAPAPLSSHAPLQSARHTPAPARPVSPRAPPRGRSSLERLERYRSRA
jgi:hypothetical protein